MVGKLKDVLERAEAWPPEDQAELAEVAELIESRRLGIYRPSAEELVAIDEADAGGLASEAEVMAAFKTFRGG